jgi:RNA polymerase sigma-32 factor
VNRDEGEKKGSLPARSSSPPAVPATIRKAGLPARPRQVGPPTRKSTFDQYIEEITSVPLLSREEELDLARRFQEQGDRQAAKRLVEANLRFVVKMAYSYRHYNVKMIDLVQEGNIGLMKAVEKFNPDRGYRLISYAVWWIKAYMQNYIIRSWSMVKLGTSQMQRQLFFRSQTDKEGLEKQAVEETLGEDMELQGGADQEQVFIPAERRKTQAESELSVAARDFSLDAVIGSTDNLTYMDLIPSAAPQQEEELARREILEEVAVRLNDFVQGLPEKEMYILQRRLLTDEPETLQDIGEKFGISRERVRQLENSLKKRIRSSLREIDGVAEIL